MTPFRYQSVAPPAGVDSFGLYLSSPSSSSTSDTPIVLSGAAKESSFPLVFDGTGTQLLLPQGSWEITWRVLPYPNSGIYNNCTAGSMSSRLTGPLFTGGATYAINIADLKKFFALPVSAGMTAIVTEKVFTFVPVVINAVDTYIGINQTITAASTAMQFDFYLVGVKVADVS